MAQQTTSLRTYALTRLALILPMVLVLLSLVFFMMRVAPGDPVSAALGGRLSAEELAQRRAAGGYDKPLATQYIEYLSDVARLDFGHTITDNRPVTSVIVENGSATLELTFWAMIVAVTVGVTLGLVAGRFRDSATDIGIRLFGITIYAVPPFFLGFVSQLVFGQYLGWLPTSGRASPETQFLLPVHTHLFIVDAAISGDWTAFKDVVLHLILPAVTLGLIISGVMIRLVRVNVLQTLRADYIEAARARGVSERSVVYRHAFKNALVPVITVLGLQVALLMSGAVLTETTFNWPGIGFELVRYLNNRDYIAVQGIITFFALVVVVVSVVIDFVNAWIDPRVRY
ncbi:MAG: peptide/nickel transport system permease protein [Pseudonocardiales bacterium]|nr:peptide/nickel transport system permease protein [Pseudonocardiales bacterium]